MTPGSSSGIEVKRYQLPFKFAETFRKPLRSGAPPALLRSRCGGRRGPGPGGSAHLSSPGPAGSCGTWHIHSLLRTQQPAPGSPSLRGTAGCSRARWGPRSLLFLTTRSLSSGIFIGKRAEECQLTFLSDGSDFLMFEDILQVFYIFYRISLCFSQFAFCSLTLGWVEITERPSRGVLLLNFALFSFQAD